MTAPDGRGKPPFTETPGDIMRSIGSIRMIALLSALVVAAAAAEPPRPASPPIPTPITAANASLELMARLTLPQSLGAALKGYRTSFALTQAQLAAAAAVSGTRISRIERGLDTASTVEAIKLAGALDSIFKARFDPDTERHVMSALASARLAQHARAP